MEKLTITEALAETKLIQRKLNKSRESVAGSLCYYEHTKDPREASGGSKSFIKNELQSIYDNELRLERIRRAISDANNKTTINIAGKEKTISEWLTWKKEIAHDRKQFFQGLAQNIKNTVNESVRSPKVFKENPDSEPTIARIVVCAEVAEIEAEQMKQIEIEEKLDGQLSLKNATTTVEF